MRNAIVELSCPTCDELWDEDANYMPDPEESFVCPDCSTERHASEFARTERDLEVLQQL